MKEFIKKPQNNLGLLLVLIWLISLIVRALTALTLDHAGFFDGFYYYHVALNMASGDGMTDSIIFHYLDNPQQLPRPSNLYWMPMANILAWLGIVLWGNLVGTWRAAQIPFIFLSSLLPPLAAWLSWQLKPRKDWAIYAGLLTMFSSYWKYWVTPSSITPFAVFVAITILALAKARKLPQAKTWFITGIGAGLCHLTRIDGGLFVPLIALLIIKLSFEKGKWQDLLRFGSAASVGYLLITGPWWLRNWWVIGSPFPIAGSKTIWLQEYKDFFAYHPNLTDFTYFNQGLSPIIETKLYSLLVCQIIILTNTFVLIPYLILFSLNQYKTHHLYDTFILVALFVLTPLILIFSITTANGSLFQSFGSFIPWLMALVPPGIEQIVHWVSKYRQWHPQKASRLFNAGFTTIIIVLSFCIYGLEIRLTPLPSWNEEPFPTQKIEKYLSTVTSDDEPILINNPPYYWIATRRKALMVPSEGIKEMTIAAKEWGISWALLSETHPAFWEIKQTDSDWEPKAEFTNSLNQEIIIFYLRTQDEISN